MKRSFAIILAAVILAATLLFPGTAFADGDGTVYVDVEADRWSADAIAYATDNGYMIGTGEGVFSPDSAVTRAAVATVLWRRQGSPAPSESAPFADVPADAWYSAAVSWARENGIVYGVSDGYFDPESAVTREALAAMLFRYSVLCPVSVPERDDLSSFTDASAVSDWASEAIGWSVKAAIVEGTEENVIDPKGTATREQFAAILERFDGAFTLSYNEPVIISQYTEPEYPLVTDADFYVSTTGSDENSGSFDSPFATFGKAVSAVCELKKTKSGDIKVAFMAGNYGPLNVSLTSADSGSDTQRITYCKYGDGDVVFDNGFTVKEAEFVPITEEEKPIFQSRAGDVIMKADVSGRLTNYSPKDSMVISEDGACTLARFPNIYDDGTDQLILSGAETISITEMEFTNPILIRKLASYHDLSRLKLYGFLTFGWYKEMLSCGTYDHDTHVMYISDYYLARSADSTGGLRWEINEDGTLTYKDDVDLALVNISEELDVAGEYWVDEDTGTFYVYSPRGDYRFPGGSSPMITASDLSYVTFTGLDFVNSQDRFIYATRSHDITLDRCDFTGCASPGEAVYFVNSDPTRDYNINVTACEFSTTSSTALGIADNHEEYVFFNCGRGVRVDNCYFTLTCLKYGNRGALMVDVQGPVITHNVFRRCCWEAIDFRGTFNMHVEYNVFDECCYNGDDTGAINNWNEYRRCGNLVTHNAFINVNGGSAGRYGLYLDGTAGTEVVANLFYNCDVPVMNNEMSRYNTFCGNISVSLTDHPDDIGYKTEGTEYVLAMIEAGTPELIAEHSFYKGWKAAFDFFDAHPDLKERIMTEWPGYFDISVDLEHPEDPAFCMYASMIVTGNRYFCITGENARYSELFERYSTIENNLGFTLEENPGLVNPTLGDYRVTGEGFPDIQFEKIGRY